MLNVVDLSAIGMEDSSNNSYPTSSPDCKINLELSMTTMNKAEPTSCDANKLPPLRSCDNTILDRTRSQITTKLLSVNDRTTTMAVAAAAAAATSRTRMSSSRRPMVVSNGRSTKRSRRCSVSDAQRPCPRVTLSVPRASSRYENKENIDPGMVQSSSPPPPPPLFPSNNGGGVLRGGRVPTAASLTQPARRKRLLSESSSSCSNRSSWQPSKVALGSSGGCGENNFKCNRKNLGNSREPLRVLWTRDGNGSVAPPTSLWALRALR